MLGVAVPLRIQNAADFAHVLVLADVGKALVAKADLTGFELASLDGRNAATLEGHAAAYFLPAASFNPAAFEAAGAVTAGIAAHVTLPDPHTQYALELALGTAAALNVGTAPNNLVQLTAASKLPAVDGSLLTNLPTPSGVLLATGATPGATAQIQQFAYGAKASVFRGIGTSQPGMTRSDSIIEFQTVLGVLVFDIATGTPAVRFFGEASFLSGDIKNYANITMVNNGYIKSFDANAIRLRFQDAIIAIRNSANDVLLDTVTSGLTTVTLRDAVTNAVANNLILSHVTSGTPAAGFGVALVARLESSTTEAQEAGRLTWAWDVATHASRASKGQLTSRYISTERAAMTWGADASGPLLGFGAVTTPIAIPVLPTGAARTTEDIIAHLQSLGLARQS